MRTVPMAVLFAAMMAITFSGCSKGGDRCCDRYDADYHYRVLWDGGDCMHHHWYASRYGEFFEPNDFGRGHDSLYGSPRYRHDEDYSGFHDSDRCGHRHGHHSRGWRHRNDYNEDAVSERYAPQMAPDTEYDE
jgi:hypothetical protein